jgi:hypothetical protein
MRTYCSPRKTGINYTPLRNFRKPKNKKNILLQYKGDYDHEIKKYCGGIAFSHIT